MKAKFGAIVVDGRGKIGGHVASKNKAGAYFRTKVTPSNPRSNAQLAIRSALTANAQGWRALTESQRNAWNGAVGDFKKTNIFGDSHNPSGFNLFVRLNTTLANIGEAAITVPPAVASIGYCQGLSVAADASAHTLILTFAEAIPAGITAVVAATPQLSPGKNFVKSDLRIIGFIDAAETSPRDASADYTAKFGAVSTVGLKITVQVYFVDIASGLSGLPVQASTIVVA